MAMFQPASQLLHDIDELFAVPVARRRNTGQGFAPRLDVFEVKDKLTFQFDLPGLDKNSIDVSLHDNVLTVSGKYDDLHTSPSSTTKDKEDERHYKLRERPTGAFSRSVSVPNGLTPSEVVTKLDNGVLSLTVPKVAKESQAKKITIN